jgi:hypothetical protein
MCNDCECDNYEKCSIVGNIPLGFCCPECKFYEGENSCLKSKIKMEEQKKAILAKTLLLHKAFEPSEKVSEEELEKFP